MNLGYDGKLYILAFDHRGSFQKKFFGIDGEPDPEQTAIIADAKHLIFEGMLQAVSAGADPSVTGVLVDEQFGSTVPAEAREHGLKLAMPAERPDCEMLVAQARSGGRDGVSCVVLGRGADDAKVEHWLVTAAPVDGFIGFAIGRTIWWDPLKAYVDGKIERSAGARKIAENFLRFVAVYERAKMSVSS